MLLKTKSLSCGYEGRALLSDVSFEVDAGNYVCIVGENGAGKSTLVKTLVGLLPPLAGEIEFGEGMSLGEIGYLPQQTEIQKDFPASVWEIVLSGTLNHRTWRPFYNAEEKTKAKDTLNRLGLLPLTKKSFRELSGGQQQRVLLARALCATHRLLVMDEPVAGLDPNATNEMYEIVRQVNRDLNVTVLMVSHDVCCAIQQATHVLHLGHHARFFGTVESYRASDLGSSLLAAAGLAPGVGHHNCVCGHEHIAGVH